MTASSPLTADDVIALLDLAPLPEEGGYFRQTHVRTGDGSTTAIFYMVTPTSFSSLHRLNHDELFHVYLGDPCRMVTFRDGEPPAETILGRDLRAGQRIQHLVPAGTWQGTRLVEGGAWALLGTTMTPGFDPAGFEGATDAMLDGLSPEIATVIRPYLPSSLGDS
ncbi:MAG: cupin domain-containing protein [Thermomicrobiales bacterium]